VFVLADGLEEIERFDASADAGGLLQARHDLQALLGNGDHTIKARVYDTLLQMSQASVAVVADNIFAPGDLKAVRVVNHSLLLREYVNIVTWADDDRNTSVRAYGVYRLSGTGRELLADLNKATTDTATYRYAQRRINTSETYVYEVVGIGPLDREGLSGRDGHGPLSGPGDGRARSVPPGCPKSGESPIRRRGSRPACSGSCRRGSSCRRWAWSCPC
jgi:hypothetical protein